MYNSSKKQIWIGELRTARGNTIVIRDNQLPEASPGRIYLYNTDRNAIVEYVEEIVKPNLHDIDETAIKTAESKFGNAWKATRNEFMNKHKALLELDNPQNNKTAKKSKAVADPEPETETDGYADDSGDFDDDWSDDFDD